MRQLLKFNIDGTLAENKKAIDREISFNLRDPLTLCRAAIITGGGRPRLQKQEFAHVHPTEIKKLSILHTCGINLANTNMPGIKASGECYEKGDAL